MRCKGLVLAAWVVVFLSAGSVFCVDRYVPGVYPTIQAGIDAGGPGDEVIIASGTYTGEGNRDIDFLGKAITVRSTDPNNSVVVASTVISCGGSELNPHRGFSFVSGEGSGSVLAGLTITGGYTDRDGGGIYCYKSSPRIVSCVITGNVANYDGGGINCLKSNPEILNCRISSNMASDGGGISGRHEGRPKIVNCLLSGNSASEDGGGMDDCEGDIIGCTIVGNRAGRKGAGLKSCRAFIAGCIIWGNEPVDSVMDRSEVPLFSCVQSDCNGTGNISSDPCFVDAGYWNGDIWIEGDYRLQDYSPCIDTAGYYFMLLPGRDLAGNVRLVGDAFDMGCYEYGGGPDEDGDCLADACEPGYADDSDRDNDGILDGLEILRGTDPNIFNPLGQWSIPGDTSIIQEALFFSRDGETIVLGQGVHDENIFFGGRNIVLTSVDPNDPCVVSATIINGDTDANSATPNGRVIKLWGTEDSNCLIQGLTITGGYTTRVLGAGIDGACAAAGIASCIIQNNLECGIYNIGGPITDCTIVGNTGHGIYLRDCPGVITNCRIAQNTATLGGGICSYDNTLVISDCNIESNISSNGGGLYCNKWGAGPNPTITVSNCTFVGNSSNYGGGLYGSTGFFVNCKFYGNSASGGGAVVQSSSTFVNCEFMGNMALDGDGGAIHCGGNPMLINCVVSENWAAENGGGLFSVSKSRPIMINCTVSNNDCIGQGGGIFCQKAYVDIISSIVYGNSDADGNEIVLEGDAYRTAVLTASYSDIRGGEAAIPGTGLYKINWGAGNIDADPVFVDAGGGDYRLAGSSPCIDSGAPYYQLWGHHFADVNGNCRLADSGVDMGAYEYGSSRDSDADLLADVDEGGYGTDANVWDSDSDGLPDGIEVLRGTSPGAANEPTGLSVPGDYSVIQEGMFLAFPLETVTISPGLYLENIHFQGKDLVLQGEDRFDESIVEGTVIDGNGVGTVVTFEGVEGPNCVVRGLTIRGGRLSGVRGNGCEARIERNRIINNFIPIGSGYAGGGGVADCDGVVEYNIIMYNESVEAGGGIGQCDGVVRSNIVSKNVSEYYGGGIARCRGMLIGNTITNNYADWGGGGIWCYYDDNPTIINCLIAGNWTGTGNNGIGGGLFCESSPTVINCTITGNRACGTYGRGSGIYYYDWGGTPSIINSVVWGNEGLEVEQICLNRRELDLSVSHSNIELGAAGVQILEGTLSWGAGNIDADPCFVDPGYWDANGTPSDANDDFWVDGDFRLLPDSPCIDAGDNNSVPADVVDLDGDGNTAEPLPYDLDSRNRFSDGDCDSNSTVDIGAYEFGWIYIGDFDEGCDVDFGDFVIFALAWGSESGDLNWNPACDLALPLDEYIDWRDLNVLCENWLAGAL